MAQFEPESDEIGQYSEKQIRLENDYTDDELLIELRRRGRLERVQAEVKVPLRYISEGFPVENMISEAWQLFAHKAAQIHANGIKPVGVKEWTERGGPHPVWGGAKHLRLSVNYVVERR